MKFGVDECYMTVYDMIQSKVKVMRPY